MIRAALLTVVTLILTIAIVWIAGMMLPVAHVASGSRLLPHSSDEVYRLVSSIEDYPRWWRDVSRIEVLARDEAGRLTFRQHSSDGALVMQVVALQRPTRMVTRIADPEQPFGGTWTFEIAPAERGTRLTITEHGEVYHPLFRFVARFVLGHTRTIESFLSAAAAISG